MAIGCFTRVSVEMWQTVSSYLPCAAPMNVKVVEELNSLATRCKGAKRMTERKEKALAKLSASSSV